MDEPTTALVPDFQLRRDLQQKHSNLGKTPWPEWIENVYFLIWMKVGCSPKRTFREAEALWPLFVDEPFQHVPYQTLQKWIHAHGWKQKATQTVAGVYPQIVMETLAHLALAGLKAAENVHAAVNGEFADMDEKKERNFIEWNKLGLLAAGSGTFGTRDRVAQPVRTMAVDSDVDFDAMTTQEIIRWEADNIARSRNALPDERKR